MARRQCTSVSADVQEYLVGHLPAGSRLVIDSNVGRPFNGAELQQLRSAELRLPDSVALTRVRDFTRGRPAAHGALQRLGEPVPGGIDMSTTGASPRPRGVVGSTSHCDGAVAAASASAEQLQGIGIGVKIEQTLELGIISVVLRIDEARLDSLVQLSAKESIYKLWKPMIGQWLDFNEVSVQPRKERITARGLSRGLEGRPLQLMFHRGIPDTSFGVQSSWDHDVGVTIIAVWLEQP